MNTPKDKQSQDKENECSDIRDYHPEPGEFDLITMGWPCTGTSNAGNKTGLKHPASSLWREGFRCLIEAQPKFCIMEQPEGVIRRGLRTILASLYMAGYSFEVETISAASLNSGQQRHRLFIISYPDEWADQFKNAPCWSSQMREMVQRQWADSEWLSVRNESNGSNDGLSVQLVRGTESNSRVPKRGKPTRGRSSKELEESYYTEPSKTPGRIRARYLAGRTVTPSQASIALRRVLYLDSLSGQAT